MTRLLTSAKRRHTPDTTPPAVPASASATAGPVDITVTWAPNAAVYRAEVSRATSVGGSYSVLSDTIAGSSYVDAAPTPGQQFWYRVRARDRAGNWSDYSTPDDATVTEPLDETPPDAPASFSATVSGRDVVLVWTDDAVGDFDYTEVYRNDEDDFSGTLVAIATGLTTETYTDTPPDLDVDYFYTARSYDTSGNPSAFATSDSATIPSTALVPPANVRSENHGGRVRLDWDDVAATIDGYNIYRSLTGRDAGDYALLAALVSGTTYDDESLGDDETGWYYITAEASSVESDPSNKTAGHPLTAVAATGSVTAGSTGYWTEGVQTITDASTTDLKFGKATTNARHGWVYWPSTPFAASGDPSDVTCDVIPRGNSSGTPVNIELALVDASDVAVPTTYAEAAALLTNLTTARVAWNGISAWTAGVGESTPDLSTLIAERVASDDWFDGAPLLLILRDNGSGSGDFRGAQSAAVNGKEPILSYTFASPLGNAVAPSTPLGLVGTANDDNNTLDWTANVENDLDGYNIYRTPTAGGTQVQLNTLPVTGTHYEDRTGIQDGVSYDYTIQAVDTGDNLSAETSAVTIVTDIGDVPPPPPPPTGEEGDWETDLPLRMVATYESIGGLYSIPGMTANAKMAPNSADVANDSWYLKTTGALFGATTIPCSALPIPLGDNTQLLWHVPRSPGVAEPSVIITRLSANAAVGATSLQVDGLLAALPATVYGTQADVDNDRAAYVGQVIGGARAWITGVQYRPTADASTWYFGPPPEQFQDTLMRGFTFNLAELEDDTEYTVRLTVAIADGVIEENPREATISTRPDEIATTYTADYMLDPGNALVTHYVDGVSGNDSNNGTSSGTAWRTINKVFTAIQAASGPLTWVVKVSNGGEQVITQNLNLGTNKVLHLISANPRVTGDTAFDLVEANPTTRTRLVRPPGATVATGPAGSGATVTGSSVWTAVVEPSGPLTDFPLDDWYSYTTDRPVWVGWSEDYTGSDEAEIRQLWPISPAGATALESMDWTQYCKTEDHEEGVGRGWFWLGGTLYLRLPASVELSGAPGVSVTNPNEVCIWFGDLDVVNVQCQAAPVYGATFRMSGFELANAEYLFTTQKAKYVYLDHCLLTSWRHGIHSVYQKNPAIAYGRHETYRQCILRSWGIRAPGGTGVPDLGDYVGWEQIKKNSWLWPYAEITTVQVGKKNVSSTIQTLFVNNSDAPGGVFQLVYKGATTATIAINANAAAVQSALEALVPIGAGNVACTGGPLPGTITVTLAVALSDTNGSIIEVVYKIGKKAWSKSETTAFKGDGCAWGQVIQHCRVDSAFNGYGDQQGTAYTNTETKWAGFSRDVLDNWFRDIADDGSLETEPYAMAQRLGRNLFEWCSTGGSATPSEYGPILLFDNLFFQIGNQEAGVPRGEVGSMMLKFGRSSGAMGHLQYVHNVMWSAQPTSKGWQGTDLSGATKLFPDFLVRNNIIRVIHQVSREGTWASRWDEDFNLFAATPDGEGNTGSVDPGLRIKNLAGVQVLYVTADDVIRYRRETRSGQHSNEVAVGGASHIAFVNSGRLDTLLMDANNGNLALDPDADGAGVNPALEAGTIFPGIDRAIGGTPNWAGNAPALGRRVAP